MFCLSNPVLYQVYYWREKSLLKEESQPEEVKVMIFSGNKTEGKLPGLHPFSLYNLQIKVFNGKGEGPQSATQTFETPEGGRGGREQGDKRTRNALVP